jgi:hypothetical protein
MKFITYYKDGCEYNFRLDQVSNYYIKPQVEDTPGFMRVWFLNGSKIDLTGDAIIVVYRQLKAE